MINDRYAVLAAAVVRRAIDDLELIGHKDPDKDAIGRDAYNFICGDGLEAWCGVMGLNADYIRGHINKTCDLSKKIAFTPKSKE